MTKLPHLIKEQVDTKMTPLSYASSIGYCDGVRYLFRESPDCAYKSDEDGFFPIHIASKKGHVKVVEFFLRQYPDMSELLDRKGRNILHVAALSGKAKMVAYMLKRNELEMLINGKDKKGNTPLHLASMVKHPVVVSNLTWDKRVNLSSLNILNMTAYDVTLEFRDIFAFREVCDSRKLDIISIINIFPIFLDIYCFRTNLTTRNQPNTSNLFLFFFLNSLLIILHYLITLYLIFYKNILPLDYKFSLLLICPPNFMLIKSTQ